MSLFHAGLSPALDSDGNPISGATWNFYGTGGLTPVNVYSDSAYVTSVGSQITADAAGRFDPVFVNDSAAVRAIQKDAGGATLIDVDPVTVSSGGGSIVSSIDVSTTGTGLTATGGPITSSGTITIAGTLDLDNGGTGATTASAARTNLGLGSVATLAETTTAEYRANTADRALSTDQVWAAADYVTLTDAATVAVDLSTCINAIVTLGGNRTLGAPSNTKNGQTGVIRIVQDGTGSRTLAYNAVWKFAGGTAPVLTTTAAAVDLLFYQVVSSTFIYATLVKDVK